MKKLMPLFCLFILTSILISCQTTETIVSSPYKLKNNNTTVYSAKTFMFKNYFFTYKNGEATLVYQQDKSLNKHSEPVYLTLYENKNAIHYQEFRDSSKKIIVKILNENEVKLRINKATHTLYNPDYIQEINADTDKILADIAIWKESKY
jgi:hypothetical protein